MNFREYVAKLNKAAFEGPKRVTVGVTRRSVADLPHSPGSMSKGNLGSRADTNNLRAKESPTTGEVIGRDTATGESLIRQPGNRIVRASVGSSTFGNTVSLSNSEKVDQIRKQGVVVSSKVVSNTGWQPVSGKPGKERLTAVTEIRIEGRELLADPCTPPDVRLQIVQAANARGIGLDSTGKTIGFTQTVGGTIVANDASRQTEAYIQQLYEESKAARKQQQTLPQTISLDSLGGSSTVGQQFSANQASLWKCVDNVCVQAPDGFFATKAQCEQNCGPITYNCLNGQCVEIRGNTGQFKSLAECTASNCNTRYTCIDGTPVPKEDGEFPTLEAAIEGGCFWGYACNGGECTPAIGGAFPSLQCCLAGCTDQPFNPNDPFEDGDTLDLSGFDEQENYRIDYSVGVSGCTFSTGLNGTVQTGSITVQGPLQSMVQSVTVLASNEDGTQRRLWEWSVTGANGTEGLADYDNDSDNSCSARLTNLSINVVE